MHEVRDEVCARHLIAGLRAKTVQGSSTQAPATMDRLPQPHGEVAGLLESGEQTLVVVGHHIPANPQRLAVQGTPMGFLAQIRRTVVEKHPVQLPVRELPGQRSNESSDIIRVGEPTVDAP